MPRISCVSTFLLAIIVSSGAMSAAADKPRDDAMPKYPSTATWEHANALQRARAERSFAELKKRQVQAYQGPLFVDDENEVKLQTAQDVAKRMIVLCAVAMRGEGVPKQETLDLIEKQKLWDAVSPEEKEFLQADEPDPSDAQDMVWRLESVWVMLWALGKLEELPWPSDMCDVGKMIKVAKPLLTDPKFIAEAKLRSAKEILDAQDLTMRIHWAVRNAYLKGSPVPEKLDWSGSPDFVPVTHCAGVGVLEQRHHALNWLVKFLDPKNWDEVDTPT